MSIWPARLSVKLVSKLMSWFLPEFSGALINATALKRCCLKVLLEKAIESRRFCQHCQILAFVLLRSFGLFVAPDGITVTGFGIALAKHCNLVFCSFVLQIDWIKKTFLTEHAIACGINGLASFICLWCHTTIVATIRKVYFHHIRYPLWENKGPQFGWANSRWHKSYGSPVYTIHQWFLTAEGASLQGASSNFQGGASPCPTTWKVWSINLPINTSVFTG